MQARGRSQLSCTGTASCDNPWVRHTVLPQVERYQRFHAALTSVNGSLTGIYSRLTGGQGDAYCRWVGTHACDACQVPHRLCCALSGASMQQRWSCLWPPHGAAANRRYHVVCCPSSFPPFCVCWCSYANDVLGAFTEGVTFHVRWAGGGAGAGSQHVAMLHNLGRASSPSAGLTGSAGGPLDPSAGGSRRWPRWRCALRCRLPPPPPFTSLTR